MTLFNQKVCFHNPSKCDIVVFEAINSYVITDYILDGLNFLVYDMRPEKIYISPSVIYYFLKSLRFFNWECKKKGKIQALLVELLNHYRLGCFQFINPKVVITFIDNSPDFHWLYKKYKGPQFFAIQNGNRTNYDFYIRSARRKFYLQIFFCFGNYEKDRYAKFEHTIDKFYPIGSLQGGYYKFITKGIKIKKKYDIGIVSQFSKTLYDKNLEKDKLKWQSMNLMNTFLVRYISEYELKAALLFRKPAGDKGEIEYYSNYNNNQVDYIFNNKKEMTTYRGMDESEIVVGFFSTASLEAFGWGKKILHVDFTESDLYNDYESVIVFRNKSYDHFKKRLNQLRAESYTDYWNRTKEYASYVMNYNPELPPHIFIRKKIEEHL